MDSNGVKLDHDPLYFEHHILPLFYRTTLILGLTLPLLYLFISRLSSSSPSPSPLISNLNPNTRLSSNFKFKSWRPWILGFIALLTAFVDLCSWTEPYNLARPVYVCFYPVRGETFRHPEEKRLRIQWMCFLSAAFAAGGAAVWDGFVWVRRLARERKREGWVVGKEDEAERVKGEWWEFPGRGYVGDMSEGEDEQERSEQENRIHDKQRRGSRSLSEDDEGTEGDETDLSEPRLGVSSGIKLHLKGDGESSEDAAQPPHEEESIHSSIHSSVETPLITPTEDSETEATHPHPFFNMTAKVGVDKDENSQREAVGDISLRHWMWRLIGEGKKKLSKDNLMGLAWLLTVAAWLVMYGRSKKGKFSGMGYD
ncbi:hypothetical protein DL98DRAFT_588357 [Cadophora sp. DSE1049]|nr:hypothetical protein DL98DRAFT_588357 [Cadophora sp. DSE1049]